ncbi:MAG: SDR family NAD(P)-dependent oxidoreductase [Fimbriimonas sp.]
MDSLNGRHVVVVGGSRGIGAATALAATRAGATVSIIYRSNAAAAEALLTEIRELEFLLPEDKGISTASAFRADASDETELQEAMRAAVAANGPIHGLVISAGIFEGSPIAEMSLEFWERTMAQNLRSTFLSVKTALAGLRQAGHASVVIVSSTAGQRGSAVYSAYATSKGAQIMFMRSMALELAPNIRVNCVAPGWTETDMADASLTALGREKVAETFPLKRIGQADEVADAIIFLLSDQSRFVTGTTVTVDGGSDMRG